jgi:hypothetical protein
MAIGRIRVRFEGDQIGPQLKKNLLRQRERVNRSMLGAAQDLAAEFLVQGRENIAKAGNFTTAALARRGCSPDVSRGGGNIVISIGHKVPYWIVFQEGRVIRGKPLLWIPLSFGRTPRVARARGTTRAACSGSNSKNGLAPLLLDANTKKPQYVGKPSVRIPKKFRVLEIGRGWHEAGRFLQSSGSSRRQGQLDGRRRQA